MRSRCLGLGWRVAGLRFRGDMMMDLLLAKNLAKCKKCAAVTFAILRSSSKAPHPTPRP